MRWHSPYDDAPVVQDDDQVGEEKDYEEGMVVDSMECELVKHDCEQAWWNAGADCRGEQSPESSCWVTPEELGDDNEQE